MIPKEQYKGSMLFKKLIQSKPLIIKVGHKCSLWKLIKQVNANASYRMR